MSDSRIVRLNPRLRRPHVMQKADTITTGTVAGSETATSNNVLASILEMKADRERSGVEVA